MSVGCPSCLWDNTRLGSPFAPFLERASFHRIDYLPICPLHILYDVAAQDTAIPIDGCTFSVHWGVIYHHPHVHWSQCGARVFPTVRAHRCSLRPARMTSPGCAEMSITFGWDVGLLKGLRPKLALPKPCDCNCSLDWVILPLLTRALHLYFIS